MKQRRGSREVGGVASQWPGGAAHFGWNQEAGAYITDWLQREYAATYTVCRLAEEEEAVCLLAEQGWCGRFLYYSYRQFECLKTVKPSNGLRM